MSELKIITVRDVKAESVDFLWEPYIPLGKISIIQGDPESGKTTLALAVASAVTTGTPLPGINHTNKGSVIFQTAEDGLADTIKPRLELLGADCSKVHVIDESEYPLSLLDGRIEEAIVKMGASMLVLDPIQAYLGESNMHSANGVRPLMKRLAAVADSTGCACILIGHLNKKGGKSQYRSLGSIDIYAAARSVMTVGKVNSDGYSRVVVQNKSNLAPAGTPLLFSISDGYRITWRGNCDMTIDDLLCERNPQPGSQFAKAQQMIQSTLAKGAVPATKMGKLAIDEGISHKTLLRAKSAMGIISSKKADGWYWELPTDTILNMEEGQDGQGGHTPDLTILTGMEAG